MNKDVRPSILTNWPFQPATHVHVDLHGLSTLILSRQANKINQINERTKHLWKCWFFVLVSCMISLCILPNMTLFAYPMSRTVLCNPMLWSKHTGKYVVRSVSNKITITHNRQKYHIKKHTLNSVFKFHAIFTIYVFYAISGYDFASFDPSSRRPKKLSFPWVVTNRRGNYGKQTNKHKQRKETSRKIPRRSILSHDS